MTKTHHKRTHVQQKTIQNHHHPTKNKKPKRIPHQIKINDHKTL